MIYLVVIIFGEWFVCKFLKINWYRGYLMMVILYVWFMINCEFRVYYVDIRNE